MSSRVLRKLQGETDLATELGGLDESDQENNEDLLASGTGGGAKKKQFNVNRYDLVNNSTTVLLGYIIMHTVCMHTVLYAYRIIL